jgi:hypothetical protein
MSIYDPPEPPDDERETDWDAIEDDLYNEGERKYEDQN